MATRNIESIEYRDRVYVSYDGLRDYLADLQGMTNDPGAKGALRHVLDELTAARDRQRGITVVSSPRATAGG